MSNLVKYYVTETNTIYMIKGNGHGLVSVPNVLKNNIKIFMIFKDNSLQVLQQKDRNQLISEMLEINKKINRNNNEGMFIVTFIEDEILKNEDPFVFNEELDKIKELVNTIYNKLLSEGNLRKENFVKKVELVSLDGKYDSFINWLCLQNPSKFHAISYQQLLKNTEEKNNVFINQNSASIFNEPTKQSTMMGMQSNIKPINESLSIGTPKVVPNNNNYQHIKQKTLVRTMPNNRPGSAAFIKWYTTLFILLASLVIGICVSIVLVK